MTAVDGALVALHAAPPRVTLNATRVMTDASATMMRFTTAPYSFPRRSHWAPALSALSTRWPLRVLVTRSANPSGGRTVTDPIGGDALSAPYRPAAPSSVPLTCLV